MRDILLVAIVVIGSFYTLRRPWIGIVLWTWLSIMNPQRYCWGIAYDAPLAAIVGGSTLLGILYTKDKAWPLKGAPVTWFMIFMIWITISLIFAIDTTDDYEVWKKVMKIDVMILVGLALLHSKQHIFALTWAAASLAILGAKGGVFTFMGGGIGRVWGPPGTFVEGNNEFGLALVMTIPLLRFLQMQLTKGWARHFMTALMVLCAASALGTQSRGALLAISSMVLLLWWRGKNRFFGGIVIAVAALLLVGFMPDSWTQRMDTIGQTGVDEVDGSVLGRYSAWWCAWNLAFDYPTGAGFGYATHELFAKYSPIYQYSHSVHAAHSIYFQVLGNHGFIGLAIFLIMWATTWIWADRLYRNAKKVPQAKWCSELAGMCQASLLGYFVGGAFLSLQYYDLPYYVMSLVVLTRVWFMNKGWETEPVYQPGWKTVPGLALAQKSG